jgi:hypothetical protein
MPAAAWSGRTSFIESDEDRLLRMRGQQSSRVTLHVYDRRDAQAEIEKSCRVCHADRCIERMHVLQLYFVASRELALPRLVRIGEAA